MRPFRAGVWTDCLLVILQIKSIFSEVTILGRLGSEVKLNHDVHPENGVISSITWREGQDLAISWDGEELIQYRQFKDRGSLNTSNGVMTISRLIRDDSKVYIPRINNKDGAPVRLEVISDVPVPTVKTCDSQVSTCKLVCEGDTNGTGKVDYTWRADDNIVKDVSTNYYTLRAGDSNVKELSCEMKNKFSQRISKKISNPFWNDGAEEPGIKPNIPTGVTVFICLVLFVIFLVLFHKCKTGEFFYEKTSLPWEADFWKKNETSQRDAEFDGVAQNQTDEETPIKETRASSGPE